MAVTRLTGLASGMDYESMIKELIKVERAPIDKLKQQRQIFQWQQEIFRDTNTSLLALKTEAFNMKLSSSYKVFDASSSDNTAVTANGTSSASEGTYKILIKQLATTAEKKSAATVSPPLQSTADITDFNVSGKDFSVSFEGIQKNISWSATEGNFTTIDELKAGLQAKINDAFGSNQITVSNSGNQIIFSPTNTTYKSKITLTNGTTSNALINLNIDNYASSQISVDTQLKDLKLASGTALTFDTDDKLKFTINGSSFELNKTDSLNTLFSKVNSDANADVTMGYDSTKDEIYIRRKSSGAGKDIVLLDGAGSNFSAGVGFEATVAGKNAIVDFTDNNGLLTQNIEKASNSFTLAGVNFTLLKEEVVPTEKTITISKNIDAVYDKIKAFVDKYNETIDKLSTKLSERKEYAYQPLTEEQKKEMKEADIKLWEDKAKSGLVGGDTLLEGIVRDLRCSMNNEVFGLNSSYNQLREFGITTGAYRENGKLYIDEAKLKQTIAERPDDVLNFFSSNPLDLKGNALNGIVDVEGKDFRLTINGSTEIITLNGSYDLTTDDGKSNLIKELNEKITSKFGYNQVIASMSSDNRVVLSSPGGYSFTLNSGTINDALPNLGFTDGSKYDASQKGIIVKVYDRLNTAMIRLVEKAGAEGFVGYFDSSLIGEQLKRIDKRIEEANDRLTQIEDRYYRQFTAMESALNRMNSQSAWLAQQAGGQG